ncbi:MAG: hypothetical protein ABW047_00715 [Nitrospiraceae bacterium]
MKIFVLCMVVMFPAAIGLAETESPGTQEVKLYDHYIALQKMQQTLFQRSPEDQARLQPQIQRAERQACQRLQKERQGRVPKEEYRRQGGDQFLAFVQQFEQYCQTIP